MKKLVMLVATVAFAIPAPMAVPTAAGAAANPNVGFCKDYVAAGYDANLNRGECISLLNSYDNYDKNGANKHAVAVHECDYYAENYPADFDALWGSKSACIADIESYL
jgi:hypothetical protein